MSQRSQTDERHWMGLVLHSMRMKRTLSLMRRVTLQVS